MADIPVANDGNVSIETDPVSSFSFEGLHEKAMAYGTDTPAAEAAPEQVAEPVAEPVVEASETPNIDNASSAQLAQLSDDQLVEITVDGETVQMPWKDAKGGFQRQAHYTKSMQSLRQEQAQFNEERQALLSAKEEKQLLSQLLTDPQMLREFIARQYPDLLQGQQQLAAAAEQTDPNDIATVGQLQAIAREQEARLAAYHQQAVKDLEAREEQLTRTIEDRQATAKLATEINTTIGGLFKEHAYMKKVIPNAEDVLRYEVLQLKPQTHEEAVQAFKDVFAGWVENYKSTVAELNKSKVVEKHKLTTNNIQPPGGTVPQQTPANYKKVNPMTGKTEVDWDALRAVSLTRFGDK